MIKKTNIKELEEIFEKVISEKNNIRKEALKELKVFLRNEWENNELKFIPIDFFEKQIQKLDFIKDFSIRKNLVRAMERPIFYHVYKTKKYYDFFTDFILKVMQDTDGRVRQAGVHLSKFFVYGSEKKTVSKFLKKIKKNIDKERKKININTYFLDELSPSTFKSLCILYNEVAFHSSYFDNDEDVFLKILREENKNNPRFEHNYNYAVFEYNRRFDPIDKNGNSLWEKEMERDLQEALPDKDFDELQKDFLKLAKKVYKGNKDPLKKFSEIVDKIQFSSLEDNNKILIEVIEFFDAEKERDVQTVLQLFSDMWNYLPHIELEWRSPHNMMQENFEIEWHRKKFEEYFEKIERENENDDDYSTPSPFL